MSESQNSRYEYLWEEDLEQAGPARIKAIDECSQDEAMLADGVQEVYITREGAVLRVKTEGKIIEVEIEVPAENLKAELEKFQLAIELRNLSSSVRGRTYDAIEMNKSTTTPTNTPLDPTESQEPIIEFVIKNRDGSIEIRQVSTYVLETVMNEFAFEDENEVRLGVMADNIKEYLALRTDASSEKGLKALNNQIYLAEKAIDQNAKERIAEGELDAATYRKKFN